MIKFFNFIIIGAIITGLPTFTKANQLELSQIRKLYREFKQSIVTPLNPEEVKNTKEYKIENSEKYLEESSILLDKVNDLLAKVEGHKEFALLLIMQDILRLDIENLRMLIDGKLSIQDMDKWYYLHNKWLTELDNWYNQSFN